MRFKILGSLIQILPIRSKFSFKPVFSYEKKLRKSFECVSFQYINDRLKSLQRLPGPKKMYKRLHLGE